MDAFSRFTLAELPSVRLNLRIPVTTQRKFKWVADAMAAYGMMEDSEATQSNVFIVMVDALYEALASRLDNEPPSDTVEVPNV